MNTERREAFIGVAEAARILGVSKWMVRQLYLQRKIPSYCPRGEGKKPRLFLESDLRAWMAERRVGGDS